MDDKPVWKTILSVGLALFAIIRLAMTCSNMSGNSSKNYQTDQSESLNYMLQKSRDQYQSTIENASNDIFNASYDSISQLSDAEMAIYKIKKVKKDTLLPLDLTAKINVESNSFIQKNYDDSLKIAVKLPDNTTIFLHDYESSGEALETLKSLKQKKNIQNVSLELDEPNSKFVSYNYKDKGKKYNGFALISKEGNQFTSLEFENNKISKNELQMKAFTFLAQIIK